MKQLGLDNKLLLDVYYKEIRSILEFAVPVWHSGLTASQSKTIENVQKHAFFIITGVPSYQSNLESLNALRLSARRESLCLRYALKASASPKFRDLFREKVHPWNTRSKERFEVMNCRTKWAHNSPLNYMIGQLNKLYTS